MGLGELVRNLESFSATKKKKEKKREASPKPEDPDLDLQLWLTFSQASNSYICAWDLVFSHVGWAQVYTPSEVVVGVVNGK